MAVQPLSPFDWLSTCGAVVVVLHAVILHTAFSAHGDGAGSTGTISNRADGVGMIKWRRPRGSAVATQPLSSFDWLATCGAVVMVLHAAYCTRQTVLAATALEAPGPSAIALTAL